VPSSCLTWPPAWHTRTFPTGTGISSGSVRTFPSSSLETRSFSHSIFLFHVRPLMYLPVVCDRLMKKCPRSARIRYFLVSRFRIFRFLTQNMEISFEMNKKWSNSSLSHIVLGRIRIRSRTRIRNYLVSISGPWSVMNNFGSGTLVWSSDISQVLAVQRLKDGLKVRQKKP